MDDNDYAAMAKAEPAQPEAKGEAHPMIDSPELLHIFRAFRQAWSHAENQAAEKVLRAYIARQVAAPVPAAPVDKGEGLELPAPEGVIYELDDFGDIVSRETKFFTAEQVQACILADRARQAAIAQPSGAVPIERMLVARQAVFNTVKTDEVGSALAALKIIEEYSLSVHEGSGIAGMCRDVINALTIAAAPQPPSTGSIADDAHLRSLFGNMHPMSVDCIISYIKENYIDTRTAALIDAASKERGWDALATAYGILWHVNAGMDAPAEVSPLSVTPERGAYEARKVLHDMLTHEQRGKGINAAREVLSAIATTKAAK